MTRINRRNAKLTAEVVFLMRQRYEAREVTQMDLARELGVSINTVRNALNGVTWQSVPSTENADDAHHQMKTSERLLASKLAAPETVPDIDIARSALERTPEVDALEEILRRRSGGEDPLARFRTPEPPADPAGQGPAACLPSPDHGEETP